MPRDISRKRSGLGGSVKTAPNVNDPTLQYSIDQIYKELNELRSSVNSFSKQSASEPSEGKDGDIRLYTELAADGTKGFFVQGKFGESWASGRLSLDTINPRQSVEDVVQTSTASFETDGGGYITKSDVTFETLDNNQDVGTAYNQVAKGDHIHSHTVLTDIGTNTHPQIDTHIGTNDIHRLPNDNDALIEKVKASTPTAGSSTTWARANHTHMLDQSQTYTFTAQQNFNNSGGTAINVTGDSVFTGDVDITGNLTVDFAEAGTGDTEIGNNLDVHRDVILNNDPTVLSNNVNATHTTTVHGKTTLYNETVIDYSPGVGEAQLKLKYSNTGQFDVNVGANSTTFKTSDTDYINIDSTGIIPNTTLTSDLGSLSKKWRSIYAGELVVENLVAQEVMATVGGRIMVAPTTKLLLPITDVYSSISVEHEIFDVDDIAFMQSAPGGLAQTEALKITSEATPTVVNDPLAATDANQDAIDYFVGAGITKLVSWAGAHGLSHGQWIKIVHANVSGDANWSGVYQVYYEPDATLLPNYNNTSFNVYLALPSVAVTSPNPNDIAIYTSPYVYSVARNIDGSIANEWPADTAVVNLGHEQGDGFIDLTATQSIYNDSGPMIGLFARSSDNSNWLVPEVARFGSLENLNIAGSNDFGVIVGKNVGNTAIDGTNPFSGLVGTADGVSLYNSELKMYDGNQLAAFIGKDSNSKTVMALGNNINETTYAGSDLLFKHNGSNYVLTLNSNVDISANIDYTVTEDDVMSAIDHFLDNTNNPNSAGLYLTPRWLGFYENADGNQYWPIKVGATATGNTGDPFFEIKNAASNPTEYIRYTTTDGLEIRGQVNVGGNFPYVAYSDLDCNHSIGSGWMSNHFSLTNTSKVYIHLRVRDAENGNELYYTDDNSEPNQTTWTSLGRIDQGFSENIYNDHEQWFKFEVTPSSAGSSKRIKTENLFADGANILDIIIVQKASGFEDPNSLKANLLAIEAQTTADNAIPGNVDYELTNNIILGNGSIQIGNTIDSAVFSAGTTSFDTHNTIAGFRLGNDNGVYKFLIKNNQNDSSSDQQYIKVDTSASTTNAIEIKGALYADKLADVTPQIADAGGTYRPLTQVFTYFDGPQDAQDGNRVGDFSSTGPVLTDVRNGALVTVHIYAEGYGDEINWVNPRIIYSKYGHGTGAHIPNVVDGDVLKNGFRLRDPWKEIDWVPYGGVTDGRQASEPIWFKIADFTQEYINGHQNTPVLRINSGSSGNLANANISNSNLRNNFFDTFNMITFAMADQNDTPNEHQEFILKNLWQLNSVNDGDGSNYIKVPIMNESGNGYEDFDYYNGTSSSGPVPSSSHMWKIWPCHSISNYDLKYRRWGHDYGNNHAGTVAWENMTDSLVEAMVVRPFNYQYYADTADNGFVPHFSHTYKFYVDIPDLHEGDHAGKVQIHFGTGIPWTAYRTLSERGEIQQVTYNVTVDNAG